MKRILSTGTAVMLLFVLMSFGNSELDFRIKKFVGVWEYEAANAPDGYQNGVINLTKEKKALQGTVSIGSYTSDLEGIETTKNELNCFVSVEGEKVRLKLNFDKNTFEGVAMTSQGNIPMTGKRKSK